MSIDELRPHLLVDTAHLFGAKMRTTHEYTQESGQTTIRSESVFARITNHLGGRSERIHASVLRI
jgi:hypothetical protein